MSIKGMTKNSLIKRNQRYTQQVLTYLQHLTKHEEAQLLQPAPDGGWSAFQHLWHLMLAEEFSLSYITKKRNEGKHFGPVTWNARWRNFLLQIAMRLPFKIKAPAAVGGNPEVFPTQPSWAMLIERYTQVRERWALLLADLDEREVQRMMYKHPRAGVLGFQHALAFLKVHFERHQGSIRRLGIG
jgi:DinB superfamily